MGCIEQPNGNVCAEPSDWSTCRPWDLTEQDKLNCYVDGLQQEALNRAGAVINIKKLLGVHEQTQLLDLAKNGNAISGGDWTGYPASNAFTTLTTEWRSKQSGGSAVLQSTYIGYDFGVVKIPNGRQRYGIDANVRQHITTIKIKQSNNPKYRITKARVERSENGTQWYGVAVITLPDDNNLNTIHFKHSVSSRYWRLRPLVFANNECDSWGVQALELHDYSKTGQDNIQDKIWMENRNRDYDESWINVKGFYDLVSPELDISKFMADLGASGDYRIKINFSTAIAALNRPVIIGDMLELPSEAQYTPTMELKKKYLEVTDVTWDPDTFTPGWMPTMLLITAKPAIASEETQDIFGDLAAKVDDSGLFDNDDGNNPNYQDYSAIDQEIRSQAKTAVPERGAEGSNTIREFTEEEIASADEQGLGDSIRKINFNRNGLYVEDAMPQNGAPYTEGTTMPASPTDGDYHRLTYSGLAENVPARLYRYSVNKGRWIYLETDRRAQYDAQQATLEEYLTSPMKKPAGDIK